MVLIKKKQKISIREAHSKTQGDLVRAGLGGARIVSGGKLLHKGGKSYKEKVKSKTPIKKQEIIETGKMTFTPEEQIRVRNEELGGGVTPVDAGDIATLIGAGGIITAGGKALIKTLGKKAAIKSIARIGQTKFAHEIISGSLKGRGAIFTQRAFIGRPAKTGVEKIFNAGMKNTATRFATNQKSIGLTKNWLFKLGVSLFIADKLIEAFGTYPWAAHNTREATDTLVFGMRKALNAGNLEEYEKLSKEFNEMIEAMPTIWDKIPYLNVMLSSKKGIENAISVKQSMDTEFENLKGGN